MGEAKPMGDDEREIKETVNFRGVCNELSMFLSGQNPLFMLGISRTPTLPGGGMFRREVVRA